MIPLPAIVLLAATAALQIEPVAVLDLKRPALEGLSLSVVQGAEPLAWAGATLAGGDVNGDGVDDLVIGAPGGSDDRPSRRGRLYVIFGSVSRPRPLIDLALRRRPADGETGTFVVASDADVIIDGADDFDHLGAALAVADLDGDGLADIIAGAPRADGPGNSRADCGEVIVLRGATNLPSIIQLGSAAPAAGAAAPKSYVIVGRRAGDALGSALAVGDVTGDGLADLVVGAPLADQSTATMGALDAGEAYLVPGTKEPPALIDLANPSVAAQVSFARGADAADQFGSAIALGDFDGDGVNDIAIAARAADGPENRRPDSGEVTLLFGERREALRAGLPLAAAAIVVAPDIGDLLGGSLAMGDFDGDSKADLAIGAALGDGVGNARLDAGEIHMILGRSRADLEKLRPPLPVTKEGAPLEEAAPGPVVIDLARPGLSGVWSYYGVDPGDHLGVRWLSDVDGDGLADLFAGAEDSSSRRNSRAGGGELHIIYGGSLAPQAFKSLTAGAMPGAVLHGALGGGHFGKAATAVDLDGDGRKEIVVSAPGAGQSISGVVYLLNRSRPDLLRPTRPKK